MSRIKQVIDTLEAERADVRKRLEWIDRQLEEFRDHHQGVEPAMTQPSRGARRATARRASVRRATARSLQADVKGRIVAYLKKHPNSTAGDVAKGLGLNRNSTATRLTQMTKAGEIKKATRGYAAL